MGEKAMTHAERQRRYYRSDGKTREREYQRTKRIERNTVREFIAWDGEGINTYGPGRPQSYVLFGASTGDSITRRDGDTLSFNDCAELILSVGRTNPGAWHVGFAFDYDVNQIVRSLPYHYLRWLNKNGKVKYGPYHIAWRQGKSFRITKNTDGHTETVTIFDCFSFFACSFVKALTEQLGNVDALRERIAFVSRGKQRRSEFTLEELDSEIVPYWSEELSLMVELMSHFRDILYSAGFPITSWHGPGAIANLLLKQNNIPDHMEVPPDAVIEASQYAYAGGRFELYRVGRHPGPIYAADINSAYPDALTQLPSLKGGHWIHREIAKPATAFKHTDIKPFAIYRVLLDNPKYSTVPGFPAPPSPLFHRSKKGEMIYPWKVEGWYWGPEVMNLTHRAIAPYVTIFEMWDFIPATDTKPFAFIADMYVTRQQWKAEGRPEQLALKLGMNSIYGKLAQRVGWEEIGGAPRYHQLEWAGWITSYVRAKLYRVMYSLGPDVIAVETDGIYSGRNPTELGLTDSRNLGEWSLTQYDEIIYLQSGTYFTRSADKWNDKYRGLDPDSICVDDAKSYFASLGIGDDPKWQQLVGHTTRYIGLASAINSTRKSGVIPFRKRFGVWEQQTPREIAVGVSAKRKHFPIACPECNAGIPPAEMSHRLGIPNTHYDVKDGWKSQPHDLPWKDAIQRQWREDRKAAQAELIRT